MLGENECQYAEAGTMGGPEWYKVIVMSELSRMGNDCDNAGDRRARIVERE